MMMLSLIAFRRNSVNGCKQHFNHTQTVPLAEITSPRICHRSEGYNPIGKRTLVAVVISANRELGEGVA
jgi:hypothetical protein